MKQTSILTLTLAGLLACPALADKSSTLSSTSTVETISRYRAFPEPLIPTIPNPSPMENAALAEAINRFLSRERIDDFSEMEAFATSHAESPWLCSLLTNTAIIQYRTGYFSRSLENFRMAWQLGKNAPNSKLKPLADRAGGEYAKLLARVGRKAEIDAFLAEAEGRQFHGPASELVLAAREGRSLMEDRPEIAFRCGPLALATILRHSGRLNENARVQETSSTPKGVSLAELEVIAEQWDMGMQAAKRSPGAPFIVPSVVHWKIGHYAALLTPRANGYISKDPTFENDTLHSVQALEEECSGYFLVPNGELPAGWVAIDNDEAKTIFGKGATSGNDPTATRPTDMKCGGDSDGICRGMPGYAFHSMLVSLNIMDTPVGYEPPYGHPIWFTVTYNHREAMQPSIFTHSNLGTQWTHNWMSYIAEAGPGLARWIVPGGGAHEFGGLDPQTGKFESERSSQSVLIRTSINPPQYRLDFPDGAKDVFTFWDGVEWDGGRIFLTEKHDPQGNITRLAYDSDLRLVSITDALGRQTTLEYNAVGHPLLITGVEDPFGRRADFYYDGQRLVRVRDVLGMESEFSYVEASQFIDAITTPYGTTAFTTYESGRTRRLTATDPLGDMEVLEFNENPSVYRLRDLPETLPENMFVRNWILNARNSYHWSKKAWKEAPGDYSAAHQYHWLHTLNYTQATSPLESELPPSEGRIWYNYPGQPQNNEGATLVGTLDKPSKIGRRLDDGSTQLDQFEYNDLGNVVTEIDPQGRTTRYVYSNDGVDLVRISRDGAGTLAAFTYNAQRRPMTATDAAGQTTHYTYNVYGQPTSMTNALGEETTFEYHSADAPSKARKGRLAAIDGPLPGDSDRKTIDYDEFGNPNLLVDVDGYTLAIEYDVFERLRTITYPDGTREEIVYDRLDPIRRTDRLGRATDLTYNALRQITSTTDPLHRATFYEWCKCGDLKAIIDAMGRRTSWRYDAAGRMISKSYADGTSDQYTYESRSGRLDSMTDGRGNTRSYSYALDDSILAINYQGSTPTPSVSFTYDPIFKRLTRMQDGIGTSIFSYHPIGAGNLGAGQLASVDGPFDNDEITYTYDALGRKTGISIDGAGETSIFDPLGRITQSVNPLGSFMFSYDGFSQRPSQTNYPNGMRKDFSYFPATGDFRLQEILHHVPGDSIISRHAYLYDSMGRVTQWKREVPAASHASAVELGYDTADQLTSVQPLDPATLAPLSSGIRQFDYDPAGNRVADTIDGVTSGASFNPLNQIIYQTGPAVDGVPSLAYEWDAVNRLIAIYDPASDLRTEIEYDGMNRARVIRERVGEIVLSQTQLDWDVLSIIRERETVSGTSIRLFAHGARTEHDGNVEDTFYARDHLRSVWALLDGNAGTQAAVAFDVWGNRQPLAGVMDSAPGFTGHRTHQPTGLVMAPYRAYAPRQARWISRDPISEKGGLNLYQYVLNNPITLIDPDGAEPLSDLRGSPSSSAVGRVEKIQGKAYAVDRNGVERRLYQGDYVNEGEKVRTESCGRVKFSADRNIIVLGPDEKVIIELPRPEERPPPFLPNGKDKGDFLFKVRPPAALPTGKRG